MPKVEKTLRYRLVRHLVPPTADRQVFLAVDTLCENRPVAIKRHTLPSRLVEDRARLFSVCDSYLSLAHPGLSKPLNVFFGSTLTDFYVVSEYVSGDPFLPAVKSLSNETFFDLLGQFCSVLQYLHSRSYVHLDLHPRNVLIVPPVAPSRQWRLKVIDLPPLPLELLSEHRALVSFNLQFSAPEVLNAAPIDHRADLFSLGVLLYEGLVGESPCLGLESGGDSAPALGGSDLQTDLISPSFLGPMVRKLLDARPERRFPSAYFVLEDLNSHLPDTRIDLDSSEAVDAMTKHLPFVSASRIERFLKPIEHWLRSGSPVQHLRVEIAGMPGSGRRRTSEAIALHLKLWGLEIYRYRETSPGYSSISLEQMQVEHAIEYSLNEHCTLGAVLLVENGTAHHDPIPTLLPECGPIISIHRRLSGIESLSNNLPDGCTSRSIGITVTPLTHDEGQAFIDIALHPNTLQATLKETISTRCLALPGVLQELLLELIRSGSLWRSGVAWKAHRDLSEKVHLPDAALRLLGPAVHSLEPTEKKVLEILALTTYPLELRHLAHVVGLSEEAIVIGILRLKTAGILEMVGERVKISSPTIVDLVRWRCDESGWREEAKRALRIIGELSADRSGEIDAILALCAVGAGDRIAITEHATRAGQYFETSGRVTEASNFYKKALDSADPTDRLTRIELLERLVLLHDSVGDRGEFKRFASQLETELTSTNGEQKMRLYKLLARYHSDLGEIPESMRFVTQAAEIAESRHSWGELASCLDVIAHNSLRLGQLAPAVRVAKESIRVRVQHGLKSEVGNAINVLAGAYYMEGDYPKALSCAHHVIRFSALPSRDKQLAQAYNNLGILCMESGILHEAKSAYAKSLRIARRTGDVSRRSTVHFNLGVFHSYSGNFVLAAIHARKALALVESSGTHYGYHQGVLTLAEIFLSCGLFGAALDQISKARKSAVASADSLNQALAELQKGWTLYHLGDYAESRQTFLAVRPSLERAGYRVHQVNCALGLANNEIALGDLKYASTLLDEIAERMPRQHIISDLTYRIARGHHLLASGELHGASRTFGMAAALARRFGYRRFHFEALLAEAQSLLSLGNADNARSLLQRLSGLHLHLKYRLHEPWLSSALSDLAGLLGDRKAQQRYLLNARTALLELSHNIYDPRMRDYFLRRPDSRLLLTRSEGIEDMLYSGFSQNQESSMPTAALESIARINEQMHRRDSLKSTLSLILEETLLLSGAERGIVFFFDPDGREKMKVTRNVGRRSLADARRYTRTALRRIRQGETVYVSDTLVDPQFTKADSITHLRIRSVACVPLRSRRSIIGALYVDSQRPSLIASSELLKSLEIFSQQAAAALERAVRYFHLAEENRRLRDMALLESPRMIGQGQYFTRLKQLIAAAAGTDLPVLILGESGTGKELIAKAIHHSGKRSEEPFVCIDCGTLPVNLVESELFGYLRGAFTGAEKDKDGLFLAAKGGTIFLDEIGNTTAALQAKLLRAIQEREIRPLGSTRPVPIQARVVAATNRDLRRDAREGTFRQDLLFRLNGLTLEIPPLRERKSEIPLLVAHFLQKLSGRYGHRVQRISEEALQCLSRYHWPGNVRELENCLERAVALSRQTTITLGDLPDSIRSEAMVSWSEKKGEHRLIEEALSRFGGDKTRAADYIGWNRQKLYRKMVFYNIPRDFGRRNTA